MNKRHLRVINEIQERIPKHLLENLMKKELANPAAKRVAEEALTKPDSEISPKLKRKMRALLDSGYLDRMVEVMDPEVEKQIDEFVTKEIALAVKLGRLPKEAPKLELLAKKGNRYARRQHKRLKALFTGKDSDVADGTPDGAEDEAEHSARPDDGSVLREARTGAGIEGSARQD